MGWSYRKSFGSGPFRINFSKSGVSYSVGVKGARVNFGPKGTYVNLSSHGISYRRKITGSAEPSHLPASQLLPTVDHGSQNIASAGIDRLTDTDSKDFITELTQKSGLISYTNWFGILPMIVLLIGLIFTSFESRTVISQPATDSVLAIVTSDIGVNIRSEPNRKSSIVKLLPVEKAFHLLILLTESGSKLSLVAPQVISTAGLLRPNRFIMTSKRRQKCFYLTPIYIMKWRVF